MARALLIYILSLSVVLGPTTSWANTLDYHGNYNSITTEDQIPQADQGYLGDLLEEGISPDHIRQFLSSYRTFFFIQLDAIQRDQLARRQCFIDRSSQPDCEEQVTKMRQKLRQAYQDMRIYLALSSPTNNKSSYLQKVYSMDEVYLKPFTKEVLRRSQLEFEPSHRFGHFAISSLMDIADIPEVQALTQDEAYQALGLFKESYKEIIKEIQDEMKTKFAKIDGNSTWNEKTKAYVKRLAIKNNPHRVLEKRQELYGKFQSEFKDSYFVTLQNYPIVAFMTLPELPKAQWQNPHWPEYDESDEAMDAAILKAYEVIIDTNSDFRKQIMSYKVEHDAEELLGLAGFQPMLAAYRDNLLTIKPEDREQNHEMLDAELQTKIVDLLADEATWQRIVSDLKWVGLLVVAGIACVVGPGKFAKFFSRAKPAKKGINLLTKKVAKKKAPWMNLLVCNLGIGITANTGFYGLSNSHYQEAFRQVFSHDGGNQVIQEMSRLNEHDVSLILDSLFLFVGTGIPQVYRKLTTETSQYLLKHRAALK